MEQTNVNAKIAEFVAVVIAKCEAMKKMDLVQDYKVSSYLYDSSYSVDIEINRWSYNREKLSISFDSDKEGLEFTEERWQEFSNELNAMVQAAIDAADAELKAAQEKRDMYNIFKS